MGGFVMSVLLKVKKMLSIKLLLPTIYTIIMTIGIVSFQLALHNLPLAGLETEDYILRLRFTSNISIALSILVSILYFIGYRYPKKSVKRAIYTFVASSLILVNGVAWAILNKIEIRLGDVGSIFLDFTPLIFGGLFLLVFNIFLKGFDLFCILKKEKREIKIK